MWSGKWRTGPTFASPAGEASRFAEFPRSRGGHGPRAKILFSLPEWVIGRRLRFPQIMVARRGDQSVNGVADRPGKNLPDPSQPTVSGQVVEDMKYSITFLKQYFLLRDRV